MNQKKRREYMSSWRETRRRVDGFFRSIPAEMGDNDSTIRDSLHNLKTDSFDATDNFDVVDVRSDIASDYNIDYDIGRNEVVVLSDNPPALSMLCNDVRYGLHDSYWKKKFLAFHETSTQKYKLSHTLLSGMKESEIDPSSMSDEDSVSKADASYQIANWACKHHITHMALDDLLKILQMFNVNVPACSKTLLGTPRETVIKQKSGGDYIYLGLEDTLRHYLLLHTNNLSATMKKIDLSFNIDGLPLFSSSPISLWPILCKVANIPSSSPFVVALFCGKQKPLNLEFLLEFVEELKRLMSNGIEISDARCAVTVHSIVCDTPAKNMVKGTVQFNGYFGCDRCEQKGVYDGRMTYVKTDCVMRSNESFRAQSNKEHHKSVSPFCELSIDMIHAFPIDYMHQCNLGVTKKLMLTWISGPLKTRLSSSQINQISINLKNFKQFIPSEFARRPRDLRHVRMWKATEYRQFQMYTGQFVLKDVLPKEMYEHFMCLTVALCILMNPLLVQHHLQYAKSLLEYFIVQSAKIYGRKFVTYNVHSLIHLPDVALRYGCLENCSAYPFENYMQNIKKLVKCGPNPLVQIGRRLAELRKIESASTKFEKKKFTRVESSSPNNCFMLKSGKFCLVNEIIHGEHNSLHVLCEVFHKTKAEFDDPCDSRILGIRRVDFCHSEMTILPVKDLYRKGMFVKLNDRTGVVVPLIHNNNQQ